MECNGGQGEEKDVGLQSTADQEVPHPDVLPEQSTGDFDFNEFFNLEKTMPGLASVSTGEHRGSGGKGLNITNGLFITLKSLSVRFFGFFFCVSSTLFCLVSLSLTVEVFQCICSLQGQADIIYIYLYYQA